MKLNEAQIKQLATLGYHLTQVFPQKFVAGSQYAGYWEISAEKALEILEETKIVNKIWQRRFGKELYKF
jgi:hypothetical protein